MKYLERIAMNAEEKSVKANKLTAKESDYNIQGAILNCEKTIASQENTIDKLKNRAPLNPEHLLEATVDLEIEKRSLKIYKALLKELF